MTTLSNLIRVMLSAIRAPAALSPPHSLRGHLPALDGVRGLAVSMVLVFHFIGQMLPSNLAERGIAAITKYGILGVDLFFVLSGFLITGILYEARDKPNYFRNFYMRRVLRIFPLYYGVLALVFFVAPLIPRLQGPTLDYMLDRQAWAWFYGINIYIAEQGDWSFSYLNHFWSLCVEEHFYLFWPVIVFLLARSPRTLIAVSLATSLCAMLARPVGLMMGLSWWTTQVLTPFKLDGLALGAFLAVVVRQPRGWERLLGALPRIAAATVGLVAATFTLSVLIWRRDLELIASFREALFQVLLACLLIWALASPRGSLASRFFSSRFMVFLGTYSYGLYVYHHFISYYFLTNRTELDLANRIGSHGAAVALQATLGASASLALAYVSYELFEKQFLRLKRRFETTKPASSPAPLPEQLQGSGLAKVSDP